VRRAHHDPGDVDLGARAALDGDRHVPALLGEAIEVAGQIVAADHVEHDLDSAAAGDALHLLGEVVSAVVDRMGGAELNRTGAFFVGAAGDEDFEPEEAAERDRHGADAARAAVHECALPFASEGAFEQVRPDRKERFRHRCGLDHRKRFRDGQALAGGRDAYWA
jgi:hypothetical protein